GPLILTLPVRVVKALDDVGREHARTPRGAPPPFIVLRTPSRRANGVRLPAGAHDHPGPEGLPVAAPRLPGRPDGRAGRLAVRRVRPPGVGPGAGPDGHRPLRRRRRPRRPGRGRLGPPGPPEPPHRDDRRG